MPSEQPSPAGAPTGASARRTSPSGSAAAERRAAARPADRPRVVVALPDRRMREKILDALRGAGVEHDALEPDASLLRQLEDTDADLVVIERSQLPPRTLEKISELGDREPGVVVVDPSSDPADRARLLAAGASEVIEPTESAEAIAQRIEAVAEVEVEGGRDGPEVGGQEAEPRLVDFQSRSPQMREFLDLVHRVVDADTALLITGETGVGKERLARAIHAESPRSDGPFVAVNCGALPEQLLESELFGHEKGAFTGALETRKGHFERAHQGTIFLDEIGEMPPHLQVRLLTVLQRHEVVRLGAEQPIQVNVRVMAATNKDLEEAVQQGDFRSDLFYRLNVVPGAPPAAARPDPTDWTGRTLRDVREDAIAQAERSYLEALLRKTRGRIGETAKLAGIGARSLYDKMRRYELRKEDYRD